MRSAEPRSALEVPRAITSLIPLLTIADGRDLWSEYYDFGIRNTRGRTHGAKPSCGKSGDEDRGEGATKDASVSQPAVAVRAFNVSQESPLRHS